MGIKKGGNMAILAGAGPMGMGAIDYAIHNDTRPRLLVVTDIDESRLARVARLLPADEAEKYGVELKYINTEKLENPAAELLSLTGGAGFDDVFCFAPVRAVVETADAILGRDGCLNFFAGPVDKNFSAMFNFYNVHYNSTHIVGTSGNTDDMKSLSMRRAAGSIPLMITHIGA